MIMASVKNDFYLLIIKEEIKFIDLLICFISELQQSINVMLTTPEGTRA